MNKFLLLLKKEQAAMSRIKNKQKQKQKQKPIYLPHEIIENILSRLPVKSLLRFKAVCKQWKATISDPKFAETHLQLSNDTSFSCLVPQHPFTRLRLKNNKFRPLSALNHPPLQCSRSIIYCHCDGLYLISSQKKERANKYILWNPSRRRHRKLRYPYPLDPKSFTTICGICYDPLVKDYKVVMADPKNYAVFYCKTNSWSELKETNLGDFNIPCSHDTPFNGSIYWVFCSEHEGGFEIVYFDGRDEKFKNLKKVDRYVSFSSSRDALYLFPRQRWAAKEIRFMKKVGKDDDAWTEEIKVQLPSFCHHTIPLCCTRENKIIFRIISDFSSGRKYLLYDEAKRSLVAIRNCQNLEFTYLFPYVENLYSL